MSSEKSSFEAHLEKLKGEYKSQLPSKLDAVTTAWESLLKQWDGEAIVVLHRNVHSLVGTSGTFGFTDISKAARTLESLLKPLISETEPQFSPSASLIQSIYSAMGALEALIAPATQTQKKTDATQEAAEYKQLNARLEQVKGSEESVQETIIYYFEEEADAPDVLLQNLLSYGFRSKHFRTLETLEDAVQKRHPSLIILDLHSQSKNEQLFFAAAKQFVKHGIRVFVFSGRDEFESRLTAVRSGINSYSTKQPDIPTIISLIRYHLNLRINKPTHILIVDDQISVAEFYGTILKRVGMEVTIETSPLKVLAILQSTTPDLILLDLNMPEVNGDELAAVIRQQELFQSIPILFLSANATPDVKTELLEIGSDDLLSKDMPPDELVRHVRSRVDRSKLLTAMMYQDSLTGLLNHAQIQLAAERVFAQYKRSKTTFTIAMIDIDNFKQVNDTYGHLSGDRVIKAIAQLFQQRLRFTDYIGRFGGEEFLVIMPDMNIQDAGNLINSLRKSFSLINFKDKQKTFNVTFSAGIAENTSMENFFEQIKFADEALYRAKDRGRNIVCASLANDIR